MASVPRRPLGKNGPLVPRIGYGTMGLGIGRTAEPIPEEQRFAVLDHAYKLGCTFWDTSDFYVCKPCVNGVRRTCTPLLLASLVTLLCHAQLS